MNSPATPTAGEQLDAIMRDLDTTTAAWAAAGHGYDTAEAEAREAVFQRLKAWNAEWAAR
jgi:hypothetical protein